MAVRIPVYDQQTTPQGMLNVSPNPERIIPSVNELPGAVGQAMQEGGRAMQHSALFSSEILHKKEMEDAQSKMERSVADDYVTWHQFEQETFNNYPNGADGHARNVLNSFDTWANESLKQYQDNPEMFREYQSRLLAMRNSVYGNAVQNEAKWAVTDKSNQISNAGASYSTGVFNGMVPLDTALGNMEAMIDKVGPDPVTKSNMLAKWREQINLAWMQGQIKRDPVAVKQQLEMLQKNYGGAEGANASSGKFVPNANLGPEEASAIQASAKKLGVSANDLQAVIQYESAFNPNRWGGKGGKYLGLIQFGPEEQQTYGVKPGQSFKDQMGAVEKFLKDRGLRPGDDLSTMYKIINGGNRNVSGNASDGNGTIDQHVNNIRALQQGMPVNPTVAKVAAEVGADRLLSLDSAADQQIRANQVEFSRINAEQERAVKESQQQVLNQMLPKMTSGQLTAQDVISNQTLDFAQKEHLLNGIKAQASGLDNTTPSVFIDVFNRIHAQPDDPNKITDPDQLNAYIGHGLSFTDIQRLRGELQGKNDPDMKSLADFKKMAKSQLSKASMIMADPEGDKNYYEWEMMFDKLFQERRKEGKSVLQLLDPQSKDYLGYTIKPRSIQDAIKSQAYAIRASAPTEIPDTDKRRPNETLDEWLDRTHQFGKMGAAFDKATGNQNQ
jgi:hypothetical protein